ncbi:MAG: AAA family ATPase [Flavobacteriaceae bacterium]|nr:AAA family ATPase [Flavobacteriaceae bacterium]
MNFNDFSELLLKKFSFIPTEDQKKAIIYLSKFLISNNEKQLFILKGYAGTGKTTLMKTLVDNINHANYKVCLLAPTGRAAKVLSYYTKRMSFTIHKKIYFSSIDKFGKFQTKLKRNKLKNMLFIIDEASMISDYNSAIDLFKRKSILSDIFKYVDFETNSKLIFLGDTAQLPPLNQVSSPALDDKYLFKNHGIKSMNFTLSNVVRQSESSGILLNATEIRNKIFNNELSFNFKLFQDVEILNDGHEIQEKIESSYNKTGLNNTLIVVRSNKRANLYNQQIRKTILFNENIISKGDLLIITKNNYFWSSVDQNISFLANGDIIEILEIYSIKDIYGFKFAEIKIKLVDYTNEPLLDTVILLDNLNSENPSITYEQSNLLYNEVQKDYSNIKSKFKRFTKTKENPFFNALNVKFSYALTCHKSQGGQWKTVFIEKPYLKEGVTVEYLRWLYTAVTRAEKNLYLIGF